MRKFFVKFNSTNKFKICIYILYDIVLLNNLEQCA